MSQGPFHGSPSGMLEFRRGWRVVLASLVGVMFGANAIEVFTVGLFAPQLSTAFGWSLQQVLLSFTIATISMLCSLPLIGTAVDKVGPRNVALIGVVGFSHPFASLYWLTDSLVCAGPPSPGRKLGAAVGSADPQLH